MLNEQQIVRAHKLEKEGRTFRKIAEEIGLNPQTQHSQVVSALRYYVMGYEAATRKMESTWTERASALVSELRSIWLSRRSYSQSEQGGAMSRVIDFERYRTRRR